MKVLLKIIIFVALMFGLLTLVAISAKGQTQPFFPPPPPVNTLRLAPVQSTPVVQPVVPTYVTQRIGVLGYDGHIYGPRRYDGWVGWSLPGEYSHGYGYRSYRRPNGYYYRRPGIVYETHYGARVNVGFAGRVR